MSSLVSLRCRCGKVRGTATDVSPESGNRIVCYCASCQAFAHFLKRPDALDERGGTDIFQMASPRVQSTEGLSELRSMRLSEKGLVRLMIAWRKEPKEKPPLFFDRETKLPRVAPRVLSVAERDALR